MSSKKLKRNISGYFDVPYERFCEIPDEGSGVETCSCIDYYKLYIREVLYNDPVTVVFWSDGTKTVAKAHGDDVYSKEAGLSICIIKKLVGGTSLKNIMEDWISNNNRVTISEVRKSLRIKNETIAEESSEKFVEETKVKKKK